VLSSCPVDANTRFGWLKSGRFLRLVSAVIAAAVLSAVLYNAIMVDRIPPTFVMKVNSTSATGAANTLTSIDVDFSEEVRHETAERGFSVSPKVTGSFHWQGLKMIFTPSSKLPLSTAFRAHMAAGVTDLSGNTQSGTGDVDFTTVGPPKVASATPATGAKSVGVTASIQIKFDRLMDLQKVLAGLKVDPDFSYQASWNGPVLVISPTKPLKYGTEYTISVGAPAVDTDGTALSPYSTTFSTIGVGLRVTGLIPAPNVAGVSPRSQIAVLFDGPINAGSVENAIKLTPPVSGTTKAIAPADDRNPSSRPTPTDGSTTTVLVFTPDAPLASHTTYSVAMAATVARSDGQVAPAQEWSFTTGEAPANALNQIAFISDRGGVDNVWLMNPDGSNQRAATAELAPVTGFDVSGDGTVITYGAGGVVKKMLLSGDKAQTLTAAGNYEYAPVISPDGASVVIARRDDKGADLGYWRYSLDGSDAKQIAPDGAPAIGSVTLTGDGLTGQPGMPAWFGRAAFSADGSAMLVVRGSDGAVELMDPTGDAKPKRLSLIANSRPIWVAAENAFFVSATEDQGQTWSYYRVTTAGAATAMGWSAGDLAGNSRGIAMLVKATDGTLHVSYLTRESGSLKLLVADGSFGETSPTFSPDGSTLAFGRVQAQMTWVSAGIWTIKPDGTGLANLSTDGAYPRWLP
jgi:WD40 repeat protein